MTKRTITPEAEAALRALTAANRKARDLDAKIFELAITAIGGGVSFKAVGEAHNPPLSAPASRSRFEGGASGREHRRAQARLRSRERTAALALITKESTAA